MNNKVRCIREKMKLMNLQGLIISNPINIKYILGIDAEGIILLNDTENYFITDSRYIEEAQKLITIDDGFIIYNNKDLTETDNYVFFYNCENVGFEEDYVTYNEYKKIIRKYRIRNIEETEKIIEKLRIIKDDNEIKNIRKACQITDKCFEYILKYIKIGMTEKQIAFEMDKYMIENGADGVSFETIVASGENSSKPHAKPTNRTIRYGDVITLDFGAKYNGLVSDMTRTIFVGTIGDEIKSVYNLILNNQEKINEKIKSGVSTKFLAKSVEQNFNNNKFTLIHALGHGVGLNIHEMPYLSINSESILKENMVITNEPGIYIPDKYGIRIEDTILVKQNYGEVLTKSSKEIIII